MGEDRGLLRILGKEVGSIVQELVITDSEIVHGVEWIVEHCAILSVLLMRAVWCRRIHAEKGQRGHVL
jgi:hypothetical protein